MKQILVMMAAAVLVGCSKDTPETSQAEAQVTPAPSPEPDPVSPADEKLIADPIVEKAVRKSLEKPEGELTEADLEKVTSLRLPFRQITDVGLKEVAKLQNLKHLWLDNTRITDAGLKEIAKLQKLEGLYLEGTRITDAGLKNVTRLENLQDLWLHNTSITDVGLKEVAKMKQLKSVSMFTTGGAPWTYGAETRATFTRAGMAELRKALPNCRFNP
ncbi:MAG: hypothetical protein MKZ76_06980 [Pedosphaera sp.]|nr:hypothetical protein [Pedosphaera sp.]